MLWWGGLSEGARFRHAIGSKVVMGGAVEAALGRVPGGWVDFV